MRADPDSDYTIISQPKQFFLTVYFQKQDKQCMYITIGYFPSLSNEPTLIQDYGDDDISDTFRLAEDDI